MTFTKILLTSLTIATATLTTTAHAFDFDDRIEMSVYQDTNYETNVAKAVKMLEQKGYTVESVEPDTHRGKPTLSVEAYKNYAEYEIELSYPELRIIKEKRDD